MIYKIIKTYNINEINVFMVLGFILASLYLNFFLSRFYASEFVIIIDPPNPKNASFTLSERKINALFLAEIASSPYFYEKDILNRETKLKTSINERTGSIKFRFNSYNRDDLIRDTYRLFSLLSSGVSSILRGSKPDDVMILEKPYVESYIPASRIVISLISGLVLGNVFLFVIRTFFKIKTKKGEIKVMPSPPPNLPIVT